MSARKIKIKEVCNINNQNLSSKIPPIIHYLDTGNITRNIVKKVKQISSNEKLPDRAQRKVKNNTIIYSLVRPDQEHFGFLDNPDKNLVVSTGFLTLDIFDKNIDPKFFYYLLTQEQITKYLQRIAVSNVSTYPTCNPSDISDLELTLHSNINDQRKVSNFLTLIDKKIEINHQLNLLLEKIAKSIYEYWFFQFDFPNKENKPYRASGGHMEWSEKLKRQIPQGWKVENLKKNQLCKIMKSGINYFEGEKKYFTTSDVIENDINFNPNKIRYENRESRANMQPIKKSIWFAKMKNSKKILFFFDFSKEHIEDIILSTGFAGLECFDDSEFYIWNFINDKYFEIAKDRLSSGVTQEAINNDYLSLINILIPPKNIIKQFKVETESIYKKIYDIKLSNERLLNLKNFISPILLNDKLDIIKVL